MLWLLSFLRNSHTFQSSLKMSQHTCAPYPQRLQGEKVKVLLGPPLPATPTQHPFYGRNFKGSPLRVRGNTLKQFSVKWSSQLFPFLGNQRRWRSSPTPRNCSSGEGPLTERLPKGRDLAGGIPTFALPCSSTKRQTEPLAPVQ